jgi:hypothetical protein
MNDYNIDDDNDFKIMEAEYDMLKKQADETEQIRIKKRADEDRTKFYRQILLNMVCAIEFLDEKYDVFNSMANDESLMKDLHSALDKIRENQINTNKSKLPAQLLMFGPSLVEYLNDKYDPFDFTFSNSPSVKNLSESTNKTND